MFILLHQIINLHSNQWICFLYLKIVINQSQRFDFPYINIWHLPELQGEKIADQWSIQQEKWQIMLLQGKFNISVKEKSEV